MSSRFDAYRADGTTTVDVAFWNRIFRDIDTRIVGIEEKKASFEEVERTLVNVGLGRVNEVLQPAAERIFRVAELGFLVASSDEEATFTEGQNASLILREGDQRDLFTPSPFIALTRRSTIDDYAIARTLDYDPESGVLLFNVETVVGNPGPHNDWDVAALAGSVMAMVAALDETRSLRQGTAQDAEAADQSASDAEGARDVALGAASDANDAKGAAEAALLSFLTVYRGASATPPANGEEGHFYFDTSLQQARVYTSTGWAPLFTVSLGGVRQGQFHAADGQTEFTVAGGGFTFINVFKNGVLLSPVDDYTVASPDFTLTTGAADGDLIAYLAYYATDQTDFYAKEVADGRFVRHDGAQPLAPLEQAQARENIGLGNSATCDVGTEEGTVAAGDDGRITGAVQKANDTGLGGFTAASKALATSGTINIAPTDGNIQHCAKTAAVTFNAPTAAGVYTIIIEVHNTNATGAITLAGFSKVDGDPFTATSGHRFQIFITKSNSSVSAIVKAMQ